MSDRRGVTIGCMEARLITIEEKIAHLEHYLGELDGVVRDMHRRMDGFKTQIDQIRADLQDPQAAGGDGPATDGDQQLEDDKPPHW